MRAYIVNREIHAANAHQEDRKKATAHRVLSAAAHATWHRAAHAHSAHHAAGAPRTVARTPRTSGEEPARAPPPEGWERPYKGADGATMEHVEGHIVVESTSGRRAEQYSLRRAPPLSRAPSGTAAGGRGACARPGHMVQGAAESGQPRAGRCGPAAGSERHAAGPGGLGRRREMVHVARRRRRSDGKERLDALRRQRAFR